MREALIDVGAIADNVRHLRRLTESEVIAVVKADGYGHGALRSAIAALEGGATGWASPTSTKRSRCAKPGSMRPSSPGCTRPT